LLYIVFTLSVSEFPIVKQNENGRTPGGRLFKLTCSGLCITLISIISYPIMACITQLLADPPSVRFQQSYSPTINVVVKHQSVKRFIQFIFLTRVNTYRRKVEENMIHCIDKFKMSTSIG
jgi:hypothetical protein